MIWNTLELGASQVITIIIYVILTYRLPPEVFGIFALGAIFIDFLYVQAQTAAIDVMLVQSDSRKSRLQQVFGNLLTMYALGFALVLGIALLVSLSFETEAYKLVLPVMCLCLLPVPFQIPALYHLNKIRDFQGTAIRNVIAAILGSGAALYVAFSSYPEWALVAQRLIQSLSSMIFVCARARFWPKLWSVPQLDLSFLRQWCKFFFAQALNVAQARSLDLVIGAVLGAAALGIVRVGMRLMDALYAALGAPLGKLWVILVPENKQSDTEIKHIFASLTTLLALLLLPTFLGLFLVAEDFVAVALSDEFAQVSYVIQVLAIVGMVAPFVYFRHSALTSINRAGTLIKLSILDITFVTVCALVLSQYGLIAALSALILGALFRLFVTVPIILKAFGISWSVMIGLIYPAYLAAAFMALCVLVTGVIVQAQSAHVILFAKVLFGALGYGLYLYFVHPNWLQSQIEIVFPKISKSRLFMNKRPQT
ncbi:MAG: oligosaccharide flippase family protein [Pseudomonadota bacterium]